MNSALVRTLRTLRTDHPRIYGYVDPARVEQSLHRDSEDALDGAREFLDDSDGGRGSSYRKAQLNTLARAEGARILLGSFVDEAGVQPRSSTILDVLGGDGLLARIVRATPTLNVSLELITSDICPGMAEAALDSDLPAICQPAQELILRDGCIDGVLIAYGTHHLPPATLARACAEARRVLRKGGRLVLHDFEPGSGVAQWFANVVHPYSRNGHDYPHYGAESLAGALTGASFQVLDTWALPDPIVAWGDSPESAQAALALYLYRMYGLVGLGDETSPGVRQQVLALARDCFGPIVVDRQDHPHQRFSARVQRVAAVAAGIA